MIQMYLHVSLYERLHGFTFFFKVVVWNNLSISDLSIKREKEERYKHTSKRGRINFPMYLLPSQIIITQLNSINTVMTDLCLVQMHSVLFYTAPLVEQRDKYKNTKTSVMNSCLKKIFQIFCFINQDNFV